MEWWNAEMTDTAVQAAIWLITAVLTLWRSGALHAAHEWAGTLKDARLSAGANKLIDAADKQLSGEAGRKKLDWALNTPMAKKLGIDRTDIEAALAARDAAQGKVATLTSALNSANARIAALEAQLAALAGPLKAVTGPLTTIGDKACDGIGNLAESFGLPRDGGPDA